MLRTRPAVFVSRRMLANMPVPRRLPGPGALLVALGQEPAAGRGQRLLIDVEREIDALRASLSALGLELDGALYCPHHPDARARDLQTRCDCRAPEPGLFVRAREELGIDLGRSWAVLETPAEREAAARAGVGHLGDSTEGAFAALSDCPSPMSASCDGTILVNDRFGTAPVIVHANGRACRRRRWHEVRRACFAREAARGRPRAAPSVTVLTWNSDGDTDADYAATPRHPGMLEASLDRLGCSCRVLGRNRGPLRAMSDKLELLLEALETVDTPLVAGVDSYDAVALDDPAVIARRFADIGDCGLLFGAEYPCWPRPFGGFARIAQFQRAHARGGVPYLQGGMWVGQLDTCREFFAAAASAPLHAVADASIPPNLADWEQPRYVWTLPRFHPRVQVDHQCTIFQSLTCPSADVRVIPL